MTCPLQAKGCYTILSDPFNGTTLLGIKHSVKYSRFIIMAGVRNPITAALAIMTCVWWTSIFPVSVGAQDFDFFVLAWTWGPTFCQSGKDCIEEPM